MQRKFFPFVRGVRGGPQPPSEDQFCENILSFLTFSRGKNEFFQSCSEWCQKLKNNRLYFSAFGGGDQKPQMQNFRHFFCFSYFVSLPNPVSEAQKTSGWVTGAVFLLSVEITDYQTVASTKGVLGSISVNFANRCNIFAKELPSLFGVSAEITGQASRLLIIMVLCCN